MKQQSIPTFLSIRALAQFAGCSKQIPHDRLKDGTLKPSAMLSNGDFLFTHADADLLRRKIKRKNT